jgi:sigma-E factor negative regulatory protein RseC
MLKEKATVVSAEGSRAKVAIMRSEACGNCPARSTCSTASGNINILEVSNRAKAQPGEKVVIELQPDRLVKATLLMYLLPALAMVAGATATWIKTGSDLGTMAGAAAGLAVTTLFLYLHGHRKTGITGPVISEILSRKDPSGGLDDPCPCDS